jgi:hypothetical protein
LNSWLSLWVLFPWPPPPPLLAPGLETFPSSCTRHRSCASAVPCSRTSASKDRCRRGSDWSSKQWRAAQHSVLWMLGLRGGGGGGSRAAGGGVRSESELACVPSHSKRQEQQARETERQCGGWKAGGVPATQLQNRPATRFQTGIKRPEETQGPDHGRQDGCPCWRGIAWFGGQQPLSGGDADHGVERARSEGEPLAHVLPQ